MGEAYESPVLPGYSLRFELKKSPVTMVYHLQVEMGLFVCLFCLFVLFVCLFICFVCLFL